MLEKRERGKSEQPFNFTLRAIEATEPAHIRVAYRDERVPSLRLRVEPNGRKTFFWYRKVRGRPKFETIGQFPAMPLEQARGKASELDAKLARWRGDGYQGKNPFDRNPLRDVRTLNELMEAYIQRQIIPRSSCPEKAEKAIRHMLKKYLDEWKRKLLHDITKKAVLKLHSDIGANNGKYVANRVACLLRAAFNWASGDVGLWDGQNPARLSKDQRFREEPRTRYLTPEELVRFNAALEQETNRDLHDFIVLALSTGQRRGNILGMLWSQVAEDFSTWTIPKTKTKNKTTHTVELTSAAVRVLTERRKTRKESNPFVFPSSASLSGHLEELKRAWKLLLKRAGLFTPDDPDRLTIHSLRHTFVSYMVMAGRSLEQAGAAVGHLSPLSTKRYSHLHQAVQRETVLAGARKMRQMMTEAAKKKPQLLSNGG